MKTPPERDDDARPRPRVGRLLILGDRRSARRVARQLSGGNWSGLAMVGFIDSGHPAYSGRIRANRQLAIHPQADPVPVLGPVDELPEWLDRVGATDLVVALSGPSARRVRAKVEGLVGVGGDVRVHWAGSAAPGRAAGRPASPPEAHRPAWPWLGDRLAKRGLDLAGATIGLMLLAPLFLAIGAIIALTVGRPIFYTQVRIGQGGRPFRMFKFRSMRRDAEGSTGPIWASDRDDRCTPIGGWLRRTNIDELPQLFNVFKGEMSLVGPRPERPVFVDHFRAAMPDYDLRHAVPGGMTGWAQVHGWRGRTSLRKRVQYDLDYIHRWSFWFDFRVLFMTIQHVFFKKIAWNPPKRRPGAGR